MQSTIPYRGRVRAGPVSRATDSAIPRPQRPSRPVDAAFAKSVHRSLRRRISPCQPLIRRNGVMLRVINNRRSAQSLVTWVMVSTGSAPRAPWRASYSSHASGVSASRSMPGLSTRRMRVSGFMKRLDNIEAIANMLSRLGSGCQGTGEQASTPRRRPGPAAEYLSGVCAGGP